MEAYYEGRLSTVEQTVVVVGEIAHLVGLVVLEGARVVGRGVDRHAADVLGHAEGFKIGFELYLAAPHLEFLHEGIIIRLVLSFVLDEQIFASPERGVYLRAVADAYDSYVLTLHIGNDAQALHRAHSGGYLARTPEVFALKSREKVLRYIIGGLSEAVNVCAEDSSAGKVALELLCEEIIILDYAVLVGGYQLDLGDNGGVKALVRVVPAALSLRINEKHARINARGYLCKPALLCESCGGLYAMLFLLENEQKRGAEAPVVRLSVQVVIGNENLEIKLFELVLPVLPPRDLLYCGSFHHWHFLVLPYCKFFDNRIIEIIEKRISLRKSTYTNLSFFRFFCNINRRTFTNI